MSLVPGTQIGRYTLRRKLAEGGMAEIYLASFLGPEGFRKEVVIKLVRPVLANDEAFVQMFINEARLASRLSHANVVQIFDFDKHEDTYYLAMEYVRGQSLWSMRKRSKEWMRPMSPTLVAQLGMEVARGLSYAHRLTDRGVPLEIVHRDVTPHNVLVSYDGAVKLTDFGIAKAGNRLTSSGMLKGKFAYMSPEQARGEPVDARTDVFALGIVLWELLTGGRLFEGESDVAVLRAVQQRVIPPPARLNPDVPAGLDAAVMRALERDLDGRYASAQDLERALQQFLLSSSRSIEDTDVGAYLRQLYPDESAVSEEQPIPAPPAEPFLAATHRSGRQGSASNPGSGSGGFVADDEAQGSTQRLPPLAGVARGAPPVAAPTSVGSRLWVGLVLGMVVASAGTVFTVKWINGRTVVAAQADAALIVPPPPPRIDAGALLDAGSQVDAGARADAGADVPDAGLTPKELKKKDEKQSSVPSGFGYLMLRVQPWATVVVDQRKPEEVEGTKEFRLPAGEHVVRLIHQKSNVKLRVTIRPGKVYSVSRSFVPGAAPVSE